MHDNAEQKRVVFGLLEPLLLKFRTILYGDIVAQISDLGRHGCAQNPESADEIRFFSCTNEAT